MLGGCGTNLNKILHTSKDFHNHNNESDEIFTQEMQLVVEALRVNTLSKLTYVDSERFDNLIKDVFAGVAFQSTGNLELVAALEESCTELGFQVNDRQVGFWSCYL